MPTHARGDFSSWPFFPFFLQIKSRFHHGRIRTLLIVSIVAFEGWISLLYRRLDRIFSIGGWTIFYRRLEHIVAMIGTHMVPTVGSLPTATRRGFAVITAAVPPFLVFACCKLVRVGFAKHGEDGNEQNPALLLCRVAQESLSAVTISFFTATAVMRAFHGYCIILIQPVLVRPEHTPADSSASKQQ